MSKALVAIVAAAAVLIPPMLAAADEIKCRGGWARLYNTFQPAGRPYFQCDFTTLKCERGYGLSDNRIFELLDNDRTTVIGHFMCGGGICYDFDRGLVLLGGGRTNSMAAEMCDPPQNRPGITFGPKK